MDVDSVSSGVTDVTLAATTAAVERYVASQQVSASGVGFARLPEALQGNVPAATGVECGHAAHEQDVAAAHELDAVSWIVHCMLCTSFTFAVDAVDFTFAFDAVDFFDLCFFALGYVVAAPSASTVLPDVGFVFTLVVLRVEFFGSDWLRRLLAFFLAALPPVALANLARSWDGNRTKYGFFLRRWPVVLLTLVALSSRLGLI
ncbi:hypothetical protein PHYSODRAFT_303483 [Phytophthora sojae]|uniref:Uncharacterized protein n=1 Tax=Phytophthora sojae (strain P6497) TaxID=1094619 RepID=G4ZR51_PHYSP|nr:hypothetical protein PHYSODRAFT_303483 [Phytophthora sojae]EGZ14273.1 hypothetical protein PHYSODRAFT_303483 [Phytophthora sojae]|eukprot:XP_009531702.1 hypothetical protein PHYSODRAFT_303483 [Phytophthora sojae]